MALSFFDTANYSAAGERRECPPDFVPHLDKRALRSGLARCLPSRRRLLGKRRKLDTIAAQCLGAIERLICRGQQSGEIKTRIVRGCDADADCRANRSLCGRVAGGFERGTQPLCQPDGVWPRRIR
jgi:hypothetical protein